MIPYYPQPCITFGDFHLYAYGIFYTAALLIGALMFLHRAEGYRIRQERIGAFLLLGIPTGVLGAKLMSVVIDPGKHQFSSFGAIFAVLLAFMICYFCGLIEQDSVGDWLDIIAFASVYGWLVGRVGCALAHDHMGVATHSWLGVRFPTGTRYDLGILEVFFLLILAVVLLFVEAKSAAKFSGALFGMVNLFYGIFRFLIEFLRADPPKYFGFTPEQYSALALVCISTYVLLIIGCKMRLGLFNWQSRRLRRGHRG